MGHGQLGGRRAGFAKGRNREAVRPRIRGSFEENSIKSEGTPIKIKAGLNHLPTNFRNVCLPGPTVGPRVHFAKTYFGIPKP